jgi:hypothetical protein
VSTAAPDHRLSIDARGTHPPGVSSRDRALRAIVLAGLTVGVLDILEPIVFYGLRGVPPTRILQSVASGLLGSAAYTGGLRTAALGLGLHFLIAFAAATVYVAASLRLPTLALRPLIWGPAYGVAVYFFMNLVVLPLSAFRTRPMSLSGLVHGLIVHILLVGLPIALFASRHVGFIQARPSRTR